MLRSEMPRDYFCSRDYFIGINAAKIFIRFNKRFAFRSVDDKPVCFCVQLQVRWKSGPTGPNHAGVFYDVDQVHCRTPIFCSTSAFSS